LFSRRPFDCAASDVLFLFNVIETKFLCASSTSEFSHSLEPKATWRLLFVLSHMFFEAEQLERRHEGRAFIQHGQNRVSGLGRKHQDYPINAGVTVAF
jgi:hypothetical protein